MRGKIEWNLVGYKVLEVSWGFWFVGWEDILVRRSDG